MIKLKISLSKNQNIYFGFFIWKNNIILNIIVINLFHALFYLWIQIKIILFIFFNLKSMNYSNCFNGMRKETSNSKHSNKNFEDLLAFLLTTNCKDDLHLIYQKNLSLLKKSLKLSKETPSLDQINSYHVKCFSKKYIFLLLQL